jgi:undecaprenyl-diphosphatase
MTPDAPVAADGTSSATIGEAMVDNLSHRRHPWPRMVRLARELDALDRAVYTAVAATPTATIDHGLRRLSSAADGGKLWLGVAGLLALIGGRRGRRAAVHGTTAVALSAGAVHLAIKPLVERSRPQRSTDPSPRHVPMPTSTSFPSGHSASGIAFANAVAADIPLLAIPIRMLATATAYSRVHAGVHYPGDVIMGAVLGAFTGDLVRAAVAARRR